MNSKNLTLEEYNKILKFYNKKRPQSIYKLKKPIKKGIKEIKVIEIENGTISEVLKD